mmetsp:Transcript_30171/g.86410  ORF Transcript_30171/g.86410 Transcript_30171/m.86410 type:complete len:209 (+) Transcript_30171:848-1474(+)
MINSPILDSSSVSVSLLASSGTGARTSGRTSRCLTCRLGGTRHGPSPAPSSSSVATSSPLPTSTASSQKRTLLNLASRRRQSSSCSWRARSRARRCSASSSTLRLACCTSGASQRPSAPCLSSIVATSWSFSSVGSSYPAQSSHVAVASLAASPDCCSSMRRRACRTSSRYSWRARSSFRHSVASLSLRSSWARRRTSAFLCSPSIED